MGVLIEGRWTERDLPQEIAASGEFKRIESRFRDHISADGSTGFKAEAGRYHLYLAHSCPWAHRVLMFLVLKKLAHAFTVSLALPGRRDEGWTYDADPRFPDCTPDTLNGFRYLHQAYAASDPHYTGKVTVPTLWDKKRKCVVNNESSEIIRMLNSEFRGIAGDDTDYYPEALRPEIDRINNLVYTKINNGVYRCGLAKTQAAYDAAYDAVFEALDELELLLSQQPYLVGARPTEADWRLFPTLVRFDVAYFSLFRCNRQRIADFPNLWRYTRALYRTPGIAATVKPRYYVINYWSNPRFNPSAIVPKGTPVSYA